MFIFCLLWFVDFEFRLGLAGLFTINIVGGVVLVCCGLVLVYVTVYVCCAIAYCWYCVLVVLWQLMLAGVSLLERCVASLVGLAAATPFGFGF